MASACDTRIIGRGARLGAAGLLFVATGAVATETPKPGSAGAAPAIRAPSLDPQIDTAPKSPAEIEADALGPPVKTKTFRVEPDGRPK